ncbi:MAG: hypothetical protein MI748_06785 [Opitutales bacterium]|nr:hypothetical protein [Opitutales bacterium]
MKWIWISIFFFTCVYPVYADDVKMDEELEFDISGGDALKRVSYFVEFTKLPLIYNVSELDGLLLNPALGRMTPRQAILKMIEGTSLVLDEDKVPGIWIIRKVEDFKPLDIKGFNQYEKNLEDFKPESIFEMSPFVVESSDSIGYLSTSSLAGTRLKANLKDIAVFLQIATPEFFEDTQATDLPTLGPYLGNLEANPVNPYDFRIRGMQTTTMTRDYFVTNTDFDTYNIERITLNSGANSILYGLGDPAGIINAGLKKAYIGGDRNSIQMRCGSHDAWRVVGDVGLTLVRDRLALRVIGLSENHQNQWEGSYYKDKRLFIATTYRIFDRTIFRGNFEKIETDSRAELRYSVMDGYSGWIDAGTPVYNPSMNNPIPNGLALPNDVALFNLIAVFESPLSRNPSALMQSRNSYGTPRANPMVTTVGRNSSDSRWPLQTIIDETIFDYKHTSFNTGDGGFARGNSTIYSAIIEHSFGDTLNMEVAFFNEDYDQQSQALDRFWIFNNYVGSRVVRVDANSHLPSGVVNPNFLRPYIDINPDVDTFQENSNQEIRFTLGYEFDFGDYGSHLKWLGKHKWTGMYSANQHAQKQGSLSPHIYISDEMNRRLKGSADISGYHLIPARVYLGDAVTLDHPVPSGLRPPQIEPRINGQLEVSVYNDFTGEWENHEIPTQKMVTSRTNNLRTIDTYVLGLHSFFLDDRLITTLGYRKDKLNIKRAEFSDKNTSGKTDNSIDWGILQNGVGLGALETYTFGCVANPFSWLRLYYNASENFRPEDLAGRAVNVLGNPIDFDSGVSSDYGFGLQLLEGSLDIQFNWFEVHRRNANDHEIFDVGFSSIFRWFEKDLFEYSVKPAGRANEWLMAPETFEMALIDPTGIGDIRSYIASGMEVSAIFNPSANWRLLFNVGKQRTILSERGIYAQEWLRLRWSNFEQFLDLPSPRPSIAGPTWKEWSGHLLEPLAELIVAEGRASAQQREWRINVVTNYDFIEGPFEGFGIGAAYRWEDRPILGYITESSDDLTPNFFEDFATDTQNPITWESQSNVDVWLRYRRKLLGGKLNWTLQLNIRNLLNSNDPIAAIANPDGTSATYYIPESRIWFITNSFQF